MKQETVIFDFDGTLVKPLPLDWKRLKKTIDRMSLKEGLSLAHHKRLSEKLGRAFEYSGSLRKKLLRFLSGEEKKILPRVQRNNSGFRLLQKALAGGARILILSNNTSAVIRGVLKRELVGGRRIKIISVDRMALPKPHLFFFKKWGRFFSNGNRVLYVGNSGVDREIARCLRCRYKNVSSA